MIELLRGTTGSDILLLLGFFILLWFWRLGKK